MVMIPAMPCRRWFRFSVRTLLVFTLLVGSLMSWIAKERRQSAREQRIAKSLEELGWTVHFAGRFDSHESRTDQYQWWQTLATDLLGIRVIGARSTDKWGIRVARPKSGFDDLAPLAELSRLHSLEAYPNDLKPLARLTTLESLTLNSRHIHDLTPLAGLRNLRRLEIRHTQASDLAPLRGLRNLESLDIADTRISDLAPLSELVKLKSLTIVYAPVGDLTPLAGLANLQWLYLSVPVDDERVRTLKQALPKCEMKNALKIR